MTEPLPGTTAHRLYSLLPAIHRTRDAETGGALADLLATGEVAPAIDRTYPLEAAAEALAHVCAGHTRGKVVVAV